MGQVEVYTNLTIGGQNFYKEHIHDDKEFGEHAKDLKKRDLIGPLTKATKERLKREAAAREKPVRPEETIEAKKARLAAEEAARIEEAKLAEANDQGNED